MWPWLDNNYILSGVFCPVAKQTPKREKRERGTAKGMVGVVFGVGGWLKG